MADKPSARGAEAPLAKYKAKRNFSVTPEPTGTGSRRAAGRKQQAPSFVIQKHWASRLHYDFRLEHGGVMLSWAVPKGPSIDPAVKQMAIHVEDHPISYSDFEGEIPKKQYGAGTVIVWDRGTWEPVGDVAEGLAKGKLIFHLHGEKLAGLWELVRISKPGDKKQEQWLLLKKRGDGWTRSTADYDVIAALPDSVIAHPLGLLEDREAPAATAKRSPVQADGDEPDLTNAVKGKMPEVLEPQLATLVSAAPAGGSWIIENKYDGYRMLARIVGGDVRLLTRKGNDWTSKLKELASHVEALGIADAYLDGEIVVLDEKGVPDFNRLQNAIDNSRSKDLVYFVFDVPFLADTDLRAVPLMSRRAVLKRLMAQSESERVRFSEAFDVSPDQLLAAACHMGLEGVMLKQATAPYVEGRTETWLKLKCQKRQEFIVVGFNDRKDSTTEVGNLLLGYHDKGKLLYAGAVGTGWSNATARELHQLLAKHETDVPAVDASAVKPGRWSQRSAGAKHWVEPKVIVEVAFGEWTPDGHIRHASFRGVRTDKPAAEVDREKAKDVAAPKTAALKADAAVPAASKRGSRASPTAASKLKITHPERVIDPASGTTKIELVRYYESVADWMLPHLAGRPVSLVRAPQGVGQQLFFQKHPETKMPGMAALDPKLWPGHAALLTVDGVGALLSAAQMNTIEFHTWNSTASHIDHPDRVVFDLDPGEGVGWTEVQEAAVLMRGFLEQLGLQSWLKTSGGKGLHVVVPVAPKLTYDAVKGFSQAVVVHVAKTIPQRFVAKSGGSNRVGKIFIDYLRNGHGQTTAAAFSARARPSMGVSMPIAWEQLPEIKGGDQWTVATAREYLSFQKEDPWASYTKSRQTLTEAMKTLGYKAPRASKK
ncbi:DNA ligase D [Rhizobacter sp. OV335]|uniref:DNA ligase D n=1 Tax=Rhizobacter sp. OV335 TaxID=1500264 RepID=UPI000911B731|nr:DNA ligase D [Rhizobacter sp. OV335]SHN13707.1 bifunctional non-homologous end joining protein LigD [Rhizobacter sp. OV335]